MPVRAPLNPVPVLPVLVGRRGLLQLRRLVPSALCRDGGAVRVRRAARRRHWRGGAGSTGEIIRATRCPTSGSQRMTRFTINRALAALVILACTGTAYAKDPPSSVVPFLGGDEDGVHTVTGAFGSVKDTTVVVTFSLKGVGRFSGFVLVPDARAKQGFRKLPLPKLPAGSNDGEVTTALTANLDKDPEDELVLAFHVFRTAGSAQAGYSYNTVDYVVIDWNGKKFVRVPALENKLRKAMDARRENTTQALTEDGIRKALGATPP